MISTQLESCTGETILYFPPKYPYYLLKLTCWGGRCVCFVFWVAPPILSPGTAGSTWVRHLARCQGKALWWEVVHHSWNAHHAPTQTNPWSHQVPAPGAGTPAVQPVPIRMVMRVVCVRACVTCVCVCVRGGCECARMQL